MKTTTALVLLLALCFSGFAQPQSDRQQFIRYDSSVIALTNVRVIDGTGAPPRENQTILISNGKIDAIGETLHFPASVKTVDLKGYTVLPGLVGMHNHMFFPMGGSPPMYSNMGFSFPRLYLALGVTTIRTTGSVQPHLDLEIKKLKMHITAPYLEGPGAFTPVMHQLKDADAARKLVNYWADQGATSFKAYMNITREQLSAAVEEAHKRGLKVTGHLCSVSYSEAAFIGIDNLEHGLLANSEYVPNKQLDKCPNGVSASLRNLDINSEPVKETIRVLVAKNVAITSTLPVFEAGAPLASSSGSGGAVSPTAIGAASAVLNQRVLNVMNPDARLRYLNARSRITADSPTPILIRKSMEFERAFVAAGGLLIAGLDPTGNGGIVAGFGDLRQVELLVEAGFSPLEAIKIASFNGAKFLGEDSRIGSIAVGKQADLMIVKGNPALKITDIENVEIVFKDGIGYDSEKLIQSVQGLVGVR
jgi:imidazolonepropionase-like amidohydrolase